MVFGFNLDSRFNRRPDYFRGKAESLINNCSDSFTISPPDLGWKLAQFLSRLYLLYNY